MQAGLVLIMSRCVGEFRCCRSLQGHQLLVKAVLDRCVAAVANLTPKVTFLPECWEECDATQKVFKVTQSRV
jgi:hypothetical protein